MKQQDEEDFPQIKSELINKIDSIAKDVGKIASEIDMHRQILYGDPVKKIKGHEERLNNLEQSEDNRKNHQKWIWTAVIAGFVERVSHFFWHFK